MPVRLKNQLLKDFSAVISASAITHAMSFVRSFSLPLLLSPTDLGQWNLITVLLGYALNSHLGLLHGLGKIIPKSFSNTDIDGKRDFKNSVFSGVLSLAFCFSLIVIVLMRNTQYSAWLLLVTVIAIMQAVYIFHLCVFRAEGDFRLYSKTVFLYSTTSTMFVIVGAWCFSNSLLGSVIGLVFAYFFVIVYLLSSSSQQLRFRFNFKFLNLAFHVGLPQTILGLIDMVVYTVDRWIVAANFTNDELGHYAFAGLFSIFVSTIPLAISQVLYTSFLNQSRNDTCSIDRKSKILDSIILTVLVTSVLTAVVSFALPLVVVKWFRKYAPAVEIGQILVLGSYFLNISHIASSYLIANDFQFRLITVQIVSIALGLAVMYLLSHIGIGVLAVALGALVLYSAYGIGYIYLALFEATINHVKSIVITGIILLPVCLNIIFKLIGEGLVDLYKISNFVQFIVVVIGPCALNIAISFWIRQNASRLKFI